MNQESVLEMQLPLSWMFYNQTLTLAIQSCAQCRQTHGILEALVKADQVANPKALGKILEGL